MKVGSLEKRSNQPKNEKFNDDCKADHNNVYAFSQQYSEYSAGHTSMSSSGLLMLLNLR